MKTVKFDKDKLEEQEAKKAIAKEQEKMRQDFFDRMKGDTGFQKYIIKEIIDAEIKANKELSNNVEAVINATPEEAKSLLLAKVGALKTVENIKNKILMRF